MQSTKDIQFLTNDLIDKKRWDACMQSSANGLLYGYSFYLDCVCNDWAALIAEDYSWVMPLCKRRKYGINYLYQPPFTQQLGIFSQENILVPLAEIIQLIQKKYSYCEVNWNYGIDVTSIPASVHYTCATNLMLDLKKGYEEIYASYHKDLIKNLKRCKQFQLSYKTTDDYGTCIQLYKNHYQDRMPHLRDMDFNNLHSLCAYALQNDFLICRKAMNEKGELLSIVLLLKDNKRIYNLLNTTTLSGRKTEANHFLLDSAIKEFSGSNLVFDFEGSDLPGVKSFYENFGAANQPYFHIKYNHLPWPLRYFKK